MRDDQTKVMVGAKGYKNVKVPMTSSIQEVLVLVFQLTGLQAYQTAFKVQTQIEGQAMLESCADKPAIFVLLSTDSDGVSVERLELSGRVPVEDRTG